MDIVTSSWFLLSALASRISELVPPRFGKFYVLAHNFSCKILFKVSACERQFAIDYQKCDAVLEEE